MPVSIRRQIVDHVFDIPRRLREIDPRLEVWYNTVSGKFEVWGVDATGSNYCLGTWPYLDVRVERAVQKGYWLAHNTGDPYRAIVREQDAEEYCAKKQVERDAEYLANVVKGETRWLTGGQWRGWRCD